VGLEHRHVATLGIAGSLVFVLAPLLVALASLDSLVLADAQWQALARAWARGSMLALGVAGLATAIAPMLARSVSPVALLALLLTSRTIDALGVLALGVRPGLLAAGLALLADLVPLAALVVALRVRTLPVELLEQAADLGAGAWARLRWVELPHLRPAFALAFAWALLEVLGDALALQLAGGGLAATPGTLIHDALVHEPAPAMAMVGMLGLLALALLLAGLLARELSGQARASARTPPRPCVAVRTIAWLAFAAVLAGPLALVLGEHPRGLAAGDRLLAALLGETLLLALVVATLAALLGFGLALALGRTPSRVAVAVLLIPLAIPAAVQGLLALLAASAIGWTPGRALTIAALLPQALALGFLVARVLIGVVPQALLDAAADLGAGPRERLRYVWLPLAGPALLTSFAIAFTWVLGQAAIPAFTSGPGGDTLAVGLTIVARSGDLPLVRRWALALVLVPLVLVAITTWFTRRSR
jgi:spermidine/putrescine transport system permease protein